MPQATARGLGGAIVALHALLLRPSSATLLRPHLESGSPPRLSIRDLPENQNKASDRPTRAELGQAPCLNGCSDSAGGTLIGANKNRNFVLQRDGNGVIYEYSTAIWATNTSVPGLDGCQKNPGVQLCIEYDGNINLYANDGIVWSTNTGNLGGPPFRLTLSEEGHLYETDGEDVVLWSSRDDATSSKRSAKVGREAATR
mmetsp:Transcript_29999/g.84497  ORF Transcript_29999/g.84497 Transcript_29999/m.84497 type:complete len:200 (-) Transcript_29999:8-607(-)